MSEQKPFSIHALELGPMENFIYLIHDHASGRAAVVDPAWDVPEVLALARRQGMQITDILLTHSHHDHINGITQVLEHSDAQLHLMKTEAQFWGEGLDLPTLHHGGDVISLGETEIRALHTPGHTPGSSCLIVEGDLAFAGDLVSSTGGPHPQRYFAVNWLQVAESLARLKSAHPELSYPGHGNRPLTREEVAGGVERGGVVPAIDRRRRDRCQGNGAVPKRLAWLDGPRSRHPPAPCARTRIGRCYRNGRPRGHPLASGGPRHPAVCLRLRPLPPMPGRPSPGL